MKIDIPLAGWLLSLATFICGTFLIPLYQRLSFDGFSVQQLSNVRSVTGDPYRHIDHFSTLLKVANVKSGAIMIEGLRAPVVTLPGFSFEPLWLDGFPMPKNLPRGRRRATKSQVIPAATRNLET